MYSYSIKFFKLYFYVFWLVLEKGRELPNLGFLSSVKGNDSRLKCVQRFPHQRSQLAHLLRPLNNIYEVREIIFDYQRQLGTVNLQLFPEASNSIMCPVLWFWIRETCLQNLVLTSHHCVILSLKHFSSLNCAVY